MKNKIIALSLLLAGACASINAQEAKSNYYTQKWTDNIFVGGGIGVMGVFNDGMNSTFNLNISAGKYFTPVYGARIQFGGFSQKIGYQDKTEFAGDTQSALEFNLDGMVDLTNVILGYNPDRLWDVYGFVGPTMNISKAMNVTYNEEVDVKNEFKAHGSKARFGATIGLGGSYKLKGNWAINAEARFGLTPSVFGNASNYNKAEGTGRFTVGATYTFNSLGGGKKFAKVEDRIIEKVVEKEVIKEVPVEVIKEIIKEVPGAGAAAIFFKIGKAKISPEGMVNIKLMAKGMKNNPNSVYKIAGFADKGTGSAKFNQTLSEKRAQAVYDALVAEGVNPNQLEKVAMGGTDPMFEKAYLNRVVIMEVK